MSDICDHCDGKIVGDTYSIGESDEGGVLILCGNCYHALDDARQIVRDKFGSERLREKPRTHRKTIEKAQLIPLPGTPDWFHVDLDKVFAVLRRMDFFEGQTVEIDDLPVHKWLIVASRVFNQILADAHWVN